MIVVTLVLHSPFSNIFTLFTLKLFIVLKKKENGMIESVIASFNNIIHPRFLISSFIVKLSTQLQECTVNCKSATGVRKMNVMQYTSYYKTLKFVYVEHKKRYLFIFKLIL